MSDELGMTGPLNRLLPAEQMKDSGGKVPDQDAFLRKRKKRRGENVSTGIDPEGTILEEETGSAPGKIVDIVI